MLKKLKIWAKSFRVYILLLSLFYICFQLLFSSYKEPIYCDILHRVTKKYVTEFAEPKGLFLCGSGGAMMNDIESVTFAFDTLGQFDVEAARTLYVDMMEEILCQINQDREIRPYLHNFPFDVKNIDLTISFKNEEYYRIDDGHVAFIFYGKGRVFYEAYNSNEAPGQQYYSLHKEPYEEARAIVFANRKCKE